MEMNPAAPRLTIDELMLLADKTGLMKTLSLFPGSTRLCLRPTAAYAKQSVETLDLSTRSYNCLMRCNITTLGQLMERIHHGELMKIRNLGRNSAAEIKRKVLTGAYNALSFSEQYRFWKDLVDGMES